jgi:hypothetical protein
VRIAKNGPGERVRAVWQATALMLEHKLRQSFGRVVFAGLEPVHRYSEHRREFAQRLRARLAVV